MTLDELLEKHPAPWVRDSSGSRRSATGHCIFVDDGSFFDAAVNRIHEMRGEMDALKAENERLVVIVNKETNWRRDIYAENVSLKSDVDALRFVEKCIKDTETENERLKARVAELEERLNSPSTCNADSVREQRRFEAACAFAATGKHNSLSCVTDADALLAALDKPEPRGPSDIIYGLMAIKKELAANQRFSAAAKMRDIVAWIMVDYSDSFDWPAFECDDEPPEPPAAEVWRIDEKYSGKDWFIIYNDDDCFRAAETTRDMAERIVSALNGGESC